MFGLPENFDCRFFVGRTLEMICFNLNQIYFHFDDHITLQVEGPFGYWRSQSQLEPDPIRPPVFSSNLMELLEHSVVAALAKTDGTLSLTFDDGHILKCFDQPDYESYHIHQGSGTITV